MRMLVALALAVHLPALLRAQSPCDGRIKDKRDHPLDYGAVAKPAPGDSYVDPAFGTLITRITHADPSEGKLAVTKTLYNTMRGWNADESLILAWDRGSPAHYEIYEGDKAYRFLFTLDFSGAPFAPSDLEHLMWDPVDPNVLWYPGGYGSRGPKGVVKLTLQRDASAITGRVFEQVFDARPLCNPYSTVERVSLGTDPHTMSYVGAGATGRYIGLVCPHTGGSGRLHIMYNLTTRSVVKTVDLGLNSNRTPPWPCPSGGCWWWKYGVHQSTHPNRVYDIAGNETGVSFAGIVGDEHAAMAATPRGYDTYNLVVFDPSPGEQAGTLISFRSDTGERRDVIGQKNGWPYPKSGTHPSIGAADGSGWVAVSGIGLPTGNPPRMGQGLLDNEILLANVATGEVCRIAHARTHAKKEVPGSAFFWGYWGEPHPQISRDGYRVLFSSDWLGSSTVDLYVIDLRPRVGTGLRGTSTR